MSHQEKQEIFDLYFKSEGYKNTKEWFEGSMAALEYDTLIKEIFAACDLVQEEQQKRIAENARMNFHDGHWKTNKQMKYFQSGADNLTVDKASITNPENKIN